MKDAWFYVVWVVSALFGLAWLVLIGWAIVELVHWVTTK